MATVTDLSGNHASSLPGGVDTKLSKFNRSNAGSPVASLTPQYPGEVVLDTTNRILWRAVGTTNADWEPTTDVLQ